MGTFNDVVSMILPGKDKAGSTPYQVRELQIKKQLALADALRESSTSAIPIQSSGGIQAPISWGSVLAKSLEGLGANLQDKRAEAGTKEVAEADRQSMRDTLMAHFKAQQAGGGGFAQPYQSMAAPQADPTQSFVDAANAAGGQAAAAPAPNPMGAAAPPQGGPPMAPLPVGAAPQPGATPPPGQPPGVSPNPTMPEGPAPSGFSQGSSDDELINALTNPGGPRSAALQSALIPKMIEQREAMHMLNSMDLTGIPPRAVRMAKVQAAQGDPKGALTTLTKAQEIHYTGGAAFRENEAGGADVVGRANPVGVIPPEKYKDYNIDGRALAPGTVPMLKGDGTIIGVKLGDVRSDARFAQDVALSGERATATVGAQAANITSPNVDTSSNAIEAVTGLPRIAIDRLMNAPNQPRSTAVVTKVDQLLTDYAIKNNVNLTTMKAKAEGIQKVIAQNVARNNQANILEGELAASVENLGPLLDQAKLGRVNKANILALWAGKQVNDPTVLQAGDQLRRFRGELAGYNAVAAGHLMENGTPAPTPHDYAAAEQTIMDGINRGGAEAVGQSVKMSAEKNRAVLAKAVDDADSDLWTAMGVGQHYKRRTKAAPHTRQPPKRPAGVPADWTLKTDKDGNYAFVSPNGRDFKEAE